MSQSEFEEFPHDPFYDECPRCHSTQLIKVIHGMPMFREEFQHQTYAARDAEGVWHYRTEQDRHESTEESPEYETFDPRIFPDVPHLYFTSYYGTPEGALYELAGCVIMMGDPSALLDTTCRACGLRYGFRDDDRNDEEEPREFDYELFG